jgi:eukaryotic-like serine/threonine-protein kinase
VALTSGVHLGPYEIYSLLGSGGMGEVYRGRDPRLGRDVAIKVLPSNASSDPGRLQRFEQEARAAAALNHPNILAVYDVGVHEGVPYIVSELLEGQTLRQRVSQGPIPVRTALDYAVQVAQGLAAAHEKGIVHRDLKPDNVFVTPDGRVKVLDFGLAKLIDQEGTGVVSSVLPTSPPGTSPGLVLGTTGYMSPEQVRGEPVDRRTDIFALGVVLYEMLTGRRPFARETVPETMTAILRDDLPDLHNSNPQVSLPLEQLLRRCLDKDPARRFQSTQDLAFALGTVGTASTSSGANVVAPVAATTTPTSSRSYVAIAVTALVALALGAILATTLRPQSAASFNHVRRLTLSLPDDEPVAPASAAPLGLGLRSIALSPDGSRLAYTTLRNGTLQLVIRDLDRFESRVIRGTEGAGFPFFSPDGTSVAFFSHNALKRVSLAGGDPTIVTEARNPRSGAWLLDGSIVFGDFEGGQLIRVPSAGGARQRLSTSSSAFYTIGALPNANAVLLDIRSTPNPDFNTIEAVSLKDGTRKVIVSGGTNPIYADGRLLFTRGGVLFAIPFDAERLEVSGSPVALIDGIRTETQGAAQVAVAQDGTLAYIEGVPAWEGSPVWVARDGTSTPLGPTKQVYGTFALSPDERRLAFEVAGATTDVWVYEIARGTFTRLTQERNNGFPVWSPDSRRIAYVTQRDEGLVIVSKPADGTGSETELWRGKSACRPGSWSLDGKYIAVVCSQDDQANDDVYVLTVGSTAELQPFVATQFSDWGPRFSPDGKWIAYISDSSGQYEVYVRPYPAAGSQVQISNNGGEEPVWSRDGRQLFYRNGTQWMSVGVATTGDFRASPPTLAFEGPYVNVPGISYDVASDGRFILIAGPPESPMKSVRVVLNWFDELKKLVPLSR